MTKNLRPRAVRTDRGMTTAEYAVGTVAIVGFGGILAKLLTDPQVQALLLKVISYLIGLIFGGGGGV